MRRTYQDLKLFNSMSILDNIMIGTQYKTEAGMIRSIVDHRKYREEEKFLREKAEETLHLIGLYDRRKEEIGSQPATPPSCCSTNPPPGSTPPKGRCLSTWSSRFTIWASKF